MATPNTTTIATPKFLNYPNKMLPIRPYGIKSSLLNQYNNIYDANKLLTIIKI